MICNLINEKLGPPTLNYKLLQTSSNSLLCLKRSPCSILTLIDPGVFNDLSVSVSVTGMVLNFQILLPSADRTSSSCQLRRLLNWFKTTSEHKYTLASHKPRAADGSKSRKGVKLTSGNKANSFPFVKLNMIWFHTSDKTKGQLCFFFVEEKADSAELLVTLYKIPSTA